MDTISTIAGLITFTDDEEKTQKVMRFEKFVEELQQADSEILEQESELTVESSDKDENTTEEVKNDETCNKGSLNNATEKKQDMKEDRLRIKKYDSRRTGKHLLLTSRQNTGLMPPSYSLYF